MQVEIAKKDIQCKIEVVPSNLELAADSELVEQILINILQNAVQALEKSLDARVSMTSQIDERGKIIIQVADNGPGIPEDMLETIFIPFFTTKDEGSGSGSGSGIGLSLSRQIMRLHRGGISVHSIPQVETVFTLRF